MNPTNSLTPSLGDIIDVTIDSLSYSGGRGVGRHESGVVVFVPLTAPGDHARVKVTNAKPRLLEGEIVEILRPSSVRRSPPCSVFGRCGGCSWQHVEYAAQVEEKKKILEHAVKKLSVGLFKPFIPAPQEFHYRNRIQVQIGPSAVGFFARGSRDLVAVEHCWISEPALNAELPKVRGSSARRVEIALDESGQVRHMQESRDPEAALFSQVNTAQNERLKTLVVESVNLDPDWIFDLYCGSGNLTLPLLKRWPSAAMTAIELSRPSIERARARHPGVNWMASDVGLALKKMSPQKDRRGLVVLDPPRTGADVIALQQIVRHMPEQIIYVSCNPTTFARDAERLQPHYTVETVQGLDMFPQTEHVELIASLRAAR